MRIDIPKGAERIIGELKKSGHQAFVVGGCVRDSLLLRTPDDWDICTSAKPDEVISALKEFKVIPTGIKHGTVTVLTKSADPLIEYETYEVTTYRVDGEYKDNRRPEDVRFVSEIKEDLARRDFTVNAMAYDHEHGLVDPFGGRIDLERGIIKCVGDPDQRFDEDALRILRGIRFASQLGFEIGNETACSLVSKAALLDNIAAERIRSEFDKLVAGCRAAEVLNEYREVIAQFIPEVRTMFGLDQENPFHLYDVWMHTMHAVRTAGKSGGAAKDKDLVVCLAAFFHDIGKPSCKVVTDGWGHFYGHEKTGAEITNTIMRRMKYDNETRHAVVKLIEKHGIVFNPNGKQARRLIHRLGERDLRRLIELERADVSAQHPDYVDERLENIGEFEKRVDELIASDQIFSMKDLAINGNDLIKTGIAQGKEIGRIKNELLRMVVDGELDNDRETLIGKAGELTNTSIRKLTNRE